MKKMDERLRKAILSLDVEYNLHQPNGPDHFMQQLIAECANLIAAIADRSSTDGLAGHQKNYTTCRRIAELRIKLDQAAMVWSADNIETFERSIMREIENTVRARRSELPMRKAWPRCKICGGLVHPRKSQDVTMHHGEAVAWTCHKCVD